MASLIHSVGHGFVADDPIYFGNLEPSNAGPAEGVTYYVLAEGLTADDFEFSDAPGGTPIDLDFDITAGIVSKLAVYTPITDPSAVMAPPVPLDPPTDLTLSSAVALDNDGHALVRLDISLTQPTSATLRHSVVRVTGPSGQPVAVVIPVGQTTASISGVLGNAFYEAVASAFDTFGNESVDSDSYGHTTVGDSTAPSTPTGLTALGAIRGVFVSWDRVTAFDLSHYDLAVSTDGGSTYPTVYPVKTAMAAITQLAPGTYHVKVRAVDLSGNASAYTSATSAVARLVTGNAADIEANSITANDIAADTITANEIAAGAITAAELDAGAVTADKIAAGAIKISKLGPEERANLGSEFFTDFTDTSAWSVINGGGGGLVATAVSDAQAGQYVGRAGNNSGNDEAWSQRNDGLLIPFDPNALYRVHARIRRNSGTGVVYVGVEGVAADGTTLVNGAGANTYSSQFYVAATGVAPGSSFTDYVGYIKGTSGTPTATTAKTNPSAPGTVHSNVRYIRPMFILNYSAVAGQMDIDIFEITRVDNSSVVNSTSEVIIDPSGITILNGAFTMKDSSGQTVMTAAGFGRAWLGFVYHGCYNPTFVGAATSDIAVSETGAGSGAANYAASISPNLPYWVVASSGATLKQVTDTAMPDGVALQSSSTATGTDTFYQDIPIFPGQSRAVWLLYSVARTSGTVTVKVSQSYRDANHVIIGSKTSCGVNSYTAAAGLISNFYPALDDPVVGGTVAPNGAAYLRIEIEVNHSVSGTNSVNIGMVTSPPQYNPIFNSVDIQKIKSSLVSNIVVDSSNILVVGEIDATTIYNGTYQIGVSGAAGTLTSGATGRPTFSGHVRCLDGVVTNQASHAVTDADFVIATPLNGAISHDTTNHRQYFKYGGAWHYSAQTAGYEVPAHERVCPANGCGKVLGPSDILIGVGDRVMDDGALHCLYVHLDCAKKGLDPDIAQMYWDMADLDEDTDGVTPARPGHRERKVQVMNALRRLHAKATTGVTIPGIAPKRKV